MKWGQLVWYLAKRTPALLFAAGLVLPATCPAFIVRTAASGVLTHQAQVVPQATGNQAPPCGPNQALPAGTIAANLTLPSPIAIASNAQNGLIGSAASTTVTIYCYPAFQVTTNYYDNFTVLAGNLAPIDSVNVSPTGSGIMLQTSVTGIDVLLTAATAQASSGPNGPNGTSGWAIGTVTCTSAGYHGGYQGVCTSDPISVTFTVQLVKTGIVRAGTISSIQLLQLYDSDAVPPPVTINYTLASNSYGTLTLSAVTVTTAACSVTAPVAVTLPTVSTTALSTATSTAGTTPFNINLNCPTSSTAALSINFSGIPVSGTYPNVLKNNAPSATAAKQVGVQMLDQNGNPIAFNNNANNTTSNLISLGMTNAGAMTLPFAARYYATGSVTPGTVSATATFNLIYN